MSLGGSSGSTKTVTSQELPGYAKKALKSATHRADLDYARGARDFYPGQTYADLTGRQAKGLRGANRLAMSGGPVSVRELDSEARRTARGRYMDEILSGDVLGQYDPAGAMGGDYNYNQAAGGRYNYNRAAGGRYNYNRAAGGALDYSLGMPDWDQQGFSDMVMASAHPELRSINSNFAAAGRSGGLADEAVADAIARNFAGALGQERSMRADLYGADRGQRVASYDAERDRMLGAYGDERGRRLGSYGDERTRLLGGYGQERSLQAGSYGDERDRQVSMVGMIPQLETAAYSPYTRMFDAGAPLQAQNQAAIDERMSRYNYDPNDESLDEYINRITAMVPGAGGVTKSSEPNTSNPLMSGLGGAATGVSMASGLGLATNPWGWGLGAAGLGLGLLGS